MSETKYLDVDGVRLETSWIGPGPVEAPTLVLLHEGLGSVSLWKDFPQRLAELSGWGVLAYSRQGYGRSDPVEVPRPLSYMHHEGLQVLPKLLNAAGIRQTILIGHSDGASIALINAGGVQDPRVIGAVLMAPHVLTEEISVASIHQARAAYEQGKLRESLKRHHGDNVDCAFWGWNRAWLDPGFLEWNIEEYLPDIDIPLLQIQGYQDEYGTAVHLEAIERQVRGPVTSLWLDGCGHSPHRDQPEAVLNAILDFLPSLASLPKNRSGMAGY
jgi:pimeloyl-ACP methyl ester carboxylesterase